ncbi:MAG TPA: hypothetical protein VHD62_06460 [Opitutaceae bacterium]|nr:hypothetical protein [Opitutaceae bacterium]
MGDLARFRVVYEEEAGEFVFAQPRRKIRKLADIAYAIAENPFAEPDYVLPDADGRAIAHVATEGYVISYWVDAPVKRVVIVEIERDE